MPNTQELTNIIMVMPAAIQNRTKPHIFFMALPITEYSCFILCFLTDSVLLSNKIKHALSALLATLLLKCVQPLIPQLHHLLTCS